MTVTSNEATIIGPVARAVGNINVTEEILQNSSRVLSCF